jgi:hypothetical protein
MLHRLRKPFSKFIPFSSVNAQNHMKAAALISLQPSVHLNRAHVLAMPVS